MALTGALFAGVSGINTNGNAMNIIGDNIANANTVGFKSSRGVFFDLLSADVGGTRIGLGSRLASSDRLFVQGGVETTNSATDMAIQGHGLFILKDAQGGTFYSRAGEFSVDKNGNLSNPAGLAVQGVQLDANGNPTSGLTNIVINQVVVSPAETSKINLAANLDASSSTPTAAIPTDAAGTSDTPANWFAASNFSTVVTVYDSLGQGHDLTVLFRKTATANEWAYRVVANADEITGGTAGNLRQVNAAGGLLAFNPDGTLDTTAPTNTNITAIGPITWANGASSQTITAANMVFTGTTQFALPSSVSQINQDGSQSGILKGINIGSDGVITGQFTSGGTQPLFRIALGDFANPQGLQHLGNSLFLQSPESGQVLVGSPGDGSFGTVLSGSLELSTVDLATEFVKMVTTQRGFQASSRTITVTDTLLEEVANLKR
ncbi:MAG TPA: flagellar hook protein FlgE [Candidatus Udaeobacter sp.]|jgi:flagellar hook protein FlgE|nr:flagellar hook protein FlgE [Candidatus Udaeobacter sp.]